jgi:hypothetical protein
MHHHGTGDAVFIPDLLLGLLAVATVIHVRDRFGTDRSRPRSHASGHVLMAMGMASMLLPSGWRVVPEVAWEVVFVLAGAYCLRTAVLEWKAGAWTSALWHGELMVGDAAMVYMLGPLDWAPLTALLIAYFVLYAAAFGGVLLWRGVTIELPEQASAISPMEARPQDGLAVLHRTLSTGSAAAHLVMAAAMVYMLTAR